MIAIIAAVSAAYGVHLVWTSWNMGWTGLGPVPPSGRGYTKMPAVERWLVQAGLDDVRPVEFAAVATTLAGLGAIVGFVVFGAAAPSLLSGLFAGSFPVGMFRRRRRTRREQAREAWPRLIEEIRVLTRSVGRSIPQALFEAGEHAPEELRSAFDAAHREWLMTTDFARTIVVLKERLADPSADVACETLLVAHEVGGADLDRRLEALADDRIQDLQDRKDARAEQAGVRFARRFVLIVPLGMAVAGISVGNGQAAYREPQGQIVVSVGLGLVAACWIWAGRIMELPEEDRVFES